MIFLQQIPVFITACVTFSPFKDCSRGSIYERSAAYQFNRSYRHLLLHRVGIMITAFMLFCGFGALTEMYNLMWLYAPSYVVASLCFVQIPVLLFGYMYLSYWTQWNGGLK